jgi:hypothetical protein
MGDYSSYHQHRPLPEYRLFGSRIKIVHHPYKIPWRHSGAVESAIPSLIGVGAPEDHVSIPVIDRHLEFRHPAGMQRPESIITPIPIRGEGIG